MCSTCFLGTQLKYVYCAGRTVVAKFWGQTQLCRLQSFKKRVAFVQLSLDCAFQCFSGALVPEGEAESGAYQDRRLGLGKWTGPEQCRTYDNGQAMTFLMETKPFPT